MKERGTKFFFIQLDGKVHKVRGGGGGGEKGRVRETGKFAKGIQGNKL